MIQKIKDILQKASTEGIHFPSAKDTATGGPSSTLFFSYMAFILGYVANIVLIVTNPLYGTLTAMGFSVIYITFYLMRRIQTFRVDLDDQELEFEGESPKKEEEHE